MATTIRSLEHYLEKVTSLRLDRNRRPHKPAMLLAVISLVAGRTIIENRVSYDAPLLGMFRKIFDVVQQPGDRCTPYFPFFHLRSSGFWHLQALPSRELELQAIDSVRISGDVRRDIAYANLDEQLFLYLTQDRPRQIISEAIISTYFARCRDELASVLRTERAVADYGLMLLQRPGEAIAADSGTPEEVRDAAFGKVVREQYDYQCAACGLRLVLDDGTTIVDAAHIIPFAVSRDNDIRNGMALCKNHHWAMDRFLIAPGLDLKWKASGSLDDRLDGQRDLIALRGRKVLVPSSERYWPKKEALEWRNNEMSQRTG